MDNLLYIYCWDIPARRNVYPAVPIMSHCSAAQFSLGLTAAERDNCCSVSHCQERTGEVG